MNLSLPVDLKFSVITRVECSGEAKWLAQISDIAEPYGAVLHTWESGQFGVAHPQYRVPALQNAAFLAALDEAGFHHSFVGTLNG